MSEHHEDGEFKRLLREVRRLPRTLDPPLDLWPAIVRGHARERRRAVQVRAWGAGLAAAAALAGWLIVRAPARTLEVFTTDAVSRARLRIAGGDIELGPGTRLRVLALRPRDQRFALERGSISARVTAPPRVFVIETRSAVVTDLGCAYTLAVDSAGNGLLHVTTGIVEFGRRGRLVYVPAGAAVPTYASRGAGIPYFVDAQAALKEALATLDSAPNDARALGLALAAARTEDGVSLWHLVLRVDATLRGAVFDRLEHLVPPPEGITREGIVRLDRAMLDRWWNYLPRSLLRKGL